MKSPRKYAPNEINYIENGSLHEPEDSHEHICKVKTPFKLAHSEDNDLPAFELQGLGQANHVYRLKPKNDAVLIEVVNVRDAIGGLIVRRGMDFVFIERPEAADTVDFMKFGETLQKSEVDILDGVLRLTIGGVRHRCSAIGVLEPDEKVERGNMKLPKGFRRPKIQNLASKDDSFGKTKWRAELIEMAKKTFPGGVESIRPQDRYVICFAGLGQEAQLWMDFGFAEENLILIERDPTTAELLRKKYPKATVIERDFEKNSTNAVFNMVYKSLRGGKFSVLSIDPESQLTIGFTCAIQKLTGDNNFGYRILAADDFVFAANFYAKRETKKVVQSYAGILSEQQRTELLNMKGDQHIDEFYKPGMINDEARRAVLARLARVGILTLSNREIVASHQGEYASGSNSPMFYTMHHIRRPKK